MNKGKPDLTGKVAIVTGAGKGLGRAYALYLAACGASVLVNNRVREGQTNSADSVVAEIAALGGSAAANYDSAEMPETGQRLVAAAVQAFGQLDIVVANAGLDVPRSFHKQELEDFDHIFAVNFHGTARLLHAAWPHLRDAREGRIVVSTSSAGLYGNHGQAAYASSKAALVGLTRSLAIEAASSGLCINAVAPYAVTPLTSPWFPEARREQFSPEAVAQLVAWLVSAECQLQGEVLIAGGGAVRRARTLETDSVVPVAGNISSAIAALEKLPLVHAPSHASEEFNLFADALR